jgi:hypothetical protein
MVQSVELGKPRKTIQIAGENALTQHGLSFRGLDTIGELGGARKGTNTKPLVLDAVTTCPGLASLIALVVLVYRHSFKTFHYDEHLDTR